MGDATEEGGELAVVVGGRGDRVNVLDVALVGGGVDGGEANVAGGKEGQTVGEGEVAAEGGGKQRRHGRGQRALRASRLQARQHGPAAQ